VQTCALPILLGEGRPIVTHKSAHSTSESRAIQGHNARVHWRTRLTGLFLGAFATSLGLSFVSTKFVRDFAIKKNWVAAPAHERHLHSNALPRLGGIAIAFSFLLTTALALLYESLFAHHGAGFSPYPLLTILPPALLIFLLGVYDDLRTAGPYLKFSVQAV